MRFDLASPSALPARLDAWILFAWAGLPVRAPAIGPGRRLLDRRLRAAVRHSGFTGEAGRVEAFPAGDGLPAGQILLVGLGRKSDFHAAALKRAVATAARAAARRGAATVALLADELAAGLGRPVGEAVREAAAACCAGAYDFTAFKSKPAARALQRCVVAVSAGGARAAAARALREGAAIGEVLTRTRDLANRPGNEATPEAVAAYARALARRTGLACQVWGPPRLRAERCRALAAVGQGSRHSPRLVILRHRAGPAGRPPVVLVGKTITFDSGGLSIKPAKNMEWMKYDKSGGMAVLAAMELVARLNLPVPVVGLLAAAENMPGGAATRPGDIIRTRSGQTVEIVNTDAEGRLVLADALSVAQDFRPSAIVDLATLTGAAVVALGHVVSAVMGNDRPLADALAAAGEAVGTRLWPLPLHREYREMITTPFADLRNTGDGTAGAIAGGMFLREFVSAGTPWAHIDLTHAWEERDTAAAAAGANLFGAELVVRWLRTLA